MPSWIGQAFRRGLLTTRYPAEAARAEELPESGRPPRPVAGAPVDPTAASGCPVVALEGRTVDDGKCIRCARCLDSGYRFSGPVEASARARAGLVRPGADGRGESSGAPPLGALGRSIHVFLVDVGSCQACNLEVLALANPYYDLQRLGIFFTNSPRHADVLLVVGVPTPAMVEPLRRAYDALPAPKAVVAAGVCAISGGIFAGNPGLLPSVEGIVPVDVFVPGCPPTPLNVLDGLLRLVGRSRPAAEV